MRDSQLRLIQASVGPYSDESMRFLRLRVNVTCVADKGFSPLNPVTGLTVQATPVDWMLIVKTAAGAVYFEYLKTHETAMDRAKSKLGNWESLKLQCT